MNILNLFDQQHVISLKSKAWHAGTVGSQIERYTTDQLLPNNTPAVVLLSAGNTDAFIEQVRENLYSLFFTHEKFSLADLGHLNTTPEHLPEIISRLINYGSFPVIIAADQALTYYQYLAYSKLEKTVNLISIDDCPDLGDIEEQLGEKNWLSHILTHEPNFLFNYSLLGYQNYLSNPEMIRSLEQLYFDLRRLGQVRTSAETTEPFFRNSDLISFDLSSIRSSDSPLNQRPCPNGLYAEEACRLIRYAGISNKMSSAGIYGWSNHFSQAETYGHLMISQLVWHLLDGYFHRIEEGQLENSDDFTIYKVHAEKVVSDIHFYKSNRSGRWWMYVPIPNSRKNRFKKHQVVPCSYDDYQQAIKGEIPETWWQTFQKMS